MNCFAPVLVSPPLFFSGFVVFPVVLLLIVLWLSLFGGNVRVGAMVLLLLVWLFFGAAGASALPGVSFVAVVALGFGEARDTGHINTT